MCTRARARTHASAHTHGTFRRANLLVTRERAEHILHCDNVTEIFISYVMRRAPPFSVSLIAPARPAIHLSATS